jgi:hypothetical protein
VDVACLLSACLPAEEGERDEDVFNNPWVGKGMMGMRHGAPLPLALLLYQARLDFNSFVASGRTAHPRGGGCSLRCRDAVDMAVNGTLLPAQEMARFAASPAVLADWDEDLHLAVEHVGTVRLLLEAGAARDVLVRSVWQTPLMIAARLGNAAVTAVLLEGGADPERMRWVGQHAQSSAWGLRRCHCCCWLGGQLMQTHAPELPRLSACLARCWFCSTGLQ